jgi:hypothetical protein
VVRNLKWPTMIYLDILITQEIKLRAMFKKL